MKKRSKSGDRGETTGQKYGVNDKVVDKRESDRGEIESFERVPNARPAQAHLRNYKLKVRLEL